MAPPRRPGTVIGLDVEKSSHWACVATRDGKVLASKPIANRESDLDSFFTEFPGAHVVVDQVRNIGALALSRARAAGMPSAYLPGPAAHEAAKLFGGDAKTDERDETYRYPLTIPRIGPKTASELAISIDIDVFPSHDKLASCCGLAPRNRQSGTSVSSVSAVSAFRQGNKRLKNLFIFSCSCLARTDGRWGEYYARCRDRGAARQGTQGRCEKEAEGDLRGHEGQGPVHRVGAPQHKLAVAARRGLRELARIPHPIEESGVDETIGTPPNRIAERMIRTPTNTRESSPGTPNTTAKVGEGTREPLRLPSIASPRLSRLPRPYGVLLGRLRVNSQSPLQ